MEVYVKFTNGKYRSHVSQNTDKTFYHVQSCFTKYL